MDEKIKFLGAILNLIIISLFIAVWLLFLTGAPKPVAFAAFLGVIVMTIARLVIFFIIKSIKDDN